DCVESFGIRWLEGETCTISGVRFVGSTLWTDFDCFADQPSYVPGSMTHNLRIREKCFRAAQYYLEKAATWRNGALFDGQAIREEALVCQQWLRTALAIPYAGKTVVITHFAPSLKSLDPRFGMTPSTAGFCNALDDLVPQADLWLHGHLHCASDYQIEACRVVCNPLGYAEKGEQLDFVPELIIEI
ncbi:MAG: metallophosphoesterase, partial [Gammaproteobacteria bacterium]